MSLFGGDSSAPPTESEYESENSIRSSTAGAEPAGIQASRDFKAASSSESDDESATESDEGESADGVPARPNRFVGKPQTWKDYTAAERQLAASLDQIRDSDLAAHLYNAHALRRRVRRSDRELKGLKTWQSRSDWLKSGDELQYTDAAGLTQTNLVPSKDWTAWPLPPSRLPSTYSASKPRSHHTEAGDWVIGGTATSDPGENLREEILAIFLRLAKQKWHSREDQECDKRGRESKSPSRSKSRSRSQSTQSTASRAYATDTEMDEDDEDSGAETRNDNRDQSDEHICHGRGRKREVDLNLKPVVLADDEKAQRLLQPSIHNILGKVDDLALALRRTRLNHLGRSGTGDASSQSEFTSDAELNIAGSSSTSKVKTTRIVSASPKVASSGRHGSIFKQKQTQNCKQKGPRESLAKDDISSGESEIDTSSTRPTRKRVRSDSIRSDESTFSTRDWSSRSGLMDWSELLAIAAVRGWENDALARTARRCAALFGESMSFIPLDEHRALDSVSKPVMYAPNIITSNTALSSVGSPVRKRPLFQIGALRCPHTDCYGHEKDFALPYRTVEHCIRVHGYDPRTNDSDNEERTVGGVHVDGFLQPVTLKPGWLGYGRTKAGKVSKKQKKDSAETDEDSQKEMEAITDVFDPSK